MLNIEKFKNELVRLGVINVDRLEFYQNGNLTDCNYTHCSNCKKVLMEQANITEEEFLKESCEENILRWLFSEYEEPEVDWSKVKVDTPILVRESEQNPWLKRHFAKFKGGKVYAWDSGKTSWSIEGKIGMLCWKYAKLAEREEQEDE